MTSRGNPGGTRVPLTNSVGREGMERDGFQAVTTVGPRIAGRGERVPEEVVPHLLTIFLAFLLLVSRHLLL